MNLKTAKATRAVIMQLLVDKGKLPGAYAQYENVPGTQTRRLKKDCAKGIYREMKKKGIIPVLAREINK